MLSGRYFYRESVFRSAVGFGGLFAILFGDNNESAGPGTQTRDFDVNVPSDIFTGSEEIVGENAMNLNLYLQVKFAIVRCSSNRFIIYFLRS